MSVPIGTRVTVAGEEYERRELSCGSPWWYDATGRPVKDGDHADALSALAEALARLAQYDALAVMAKLAAGGAA